MPTMELSSTQASTKFMKWLTDSVIMCCRNWFRAGVLDVRVMKDGDVVVVAADDIDVGSF